MNENGDKELINDILEINKNSDEINIVLDVC